MQKAQDNQPSFGSVAFVCPHCRVLAKQDWTGVDSLSKTVIRILEIYYLDYIKSNRGTHRTVENAYNFFLQGFANDLPRNLSIPTNINFAQCQSCSETTVWREKELIYPRSFPFPDPNDDMEEEIKKLYREAAKVFQDSPRASAALLRLCIEQLCRQLGETGNLNDCIGRLVKNGLDIRIQRALDYCRVIGNSAVHDAGRIDLEEDPDRATILFDLVNDIAHEMKTKPREMEVKYSSLPEGARKAIENRDR